MSYTWKPAEIAILTARYPDESSVAISADMPGRTADAVDRKAGKLGLEKSAAYMHRSYVERGKKTPTVRLSMIDANRDLLSRERGASLRELYASVGGDLVRLKSLLQEAIKTRQLHLAGKGVQSRYFLTAEAAALAVPLIAAEIERSRKATRRARLDRHATAERARRAARPKNLPKAKAPKKPKAPKAAKPQRTVAYAPAEAGPAKRKSNTVSQRWAKAEPIVPAGVKVQRLPGYTGAPKWEGKRTW